MPICLQFNLTFITIFYLSLECLNETQTLVKALRVPPTALLKTSTLLTTELWLEDSIYENNMPVSIYLGED